MIKIFNRAVLIVGALYRKMTDLTLASGSTTFTGGPIGKLHIQSLTIAGNATLDVALPYADAVDGDLVFAQSYGQNVAVAHSQIDATAKTIKLKLYNFTATAVTSQTIDIQYHIIKRK
jgi:hypothetical protein